MELNGFKKMDVVTKQETSGGSWVMLALTALPVIASSVATLVGSFRVFFSDSGEIKTKEGFSQKWDKSNGNSLAKQPAGSTTMPIYYVY